MPELPYQFVLARNVVDVPGNWLVLEQDGWRLAVHPRTRVSSIACGSDDWVGWVIGWAITGSGKVIDPTLCLDTSERAASTDKFLANLEAELAQWAGRFVLIAIAHAGQKALYRRERVPRSGVLPSRTGCCLDVRFDSTHQDLTNQCGTRTGARASDQGHLVSLRAHSARRY